MTRLPAASLLVTFLSSGSLCASAQDRQNEGIFAQGVLGFGHSSGSYHFEARVDVMGSTTTVTVDEPMGGMATDASGAIGYYLTPQLGLALDVGVHKIDADSVAIGGAFLSDPELRRMGILGHIDPGEAGGGFVQFGGGVATGKFNALEPQGGSYPFHFAPRTVFGPMGHVGVGYSHSRVAVLVRGYVGRLVSGGFRYTFRSYMLMIGVGL